MKKYVVEIEGVTNLIMCRLSKDLLNETSTIPNNQLEAWEEENWVKKAYTNGGGYVIPVLNFHSCLVDGCRKLQVKPPKAVGRTWTNYFKSSVLIEGGGVLVCDEPKPFGTMVNGNPSSAKKSSKVYKIRPMFEKGWRTSFTLFDTTGVLTVDTLEEIVRHSGLFVGLCDWRPMYGRFLPIKVKEVK